MEIVDPAHVGEPHDDVRTFYDRLASDYDAMTGFEKRFIEEKPFFRLLIERYGIRRALDAGCGTGFHSLLLAQLGVHVVAADVSHEMIRKLEEHAAAMNCRVNAVAGDVASLAESMRKKFDAVFSMGNTLAHLPSREALVKTLRSLFQGLDEGGMLFVQLLNYDRILADRQRIQSTRRSGDTLYVRFYDFEADRIQFNILRIKDAGQGFTTELQSVPLRPITSLEMKEILESIGYSSIRLFGSVSMTDFDPRESRDLVVMARREGEAGR